MIWDFWIVPVNCNLQKLIQLTELVAKFKNSFIYLVHKKENFTQDIFLYKYLYLPPACTSTEIVFREIFVSKYKKKYSI